MTPRATILASAAIAAIFLVPACGGDEDSDSGGAAGTSGGSAGAGAEEAGQAGSNGNGDSGAAGGESSLETSSLSKEQFLTQANAACQRERRNYNEEVTAFLMSPDLKGLSEEEVGLKAVKTILVPITEAQIKAVRGLGAPEGDEDEVEAALEAQEEAVDELRRSEQIDRSESVEEFFADSSALLRDYGLTDCVFRT